MDLFKLRMTATLVFGASAALCASANSHANARVAESVPQAIPYTSPWSFELGTRYWLGWGKYTKDLYGAVDDGHMVSRLTYDDYTSNAAEGFWRLGHHNGVFLKGYLGGGSFNGGHLIDEDFPPETMPYSRTTSDLKHGELNYFSADMGYDLFREDSWRLGGFVGYHRWMTRYNAFGCEQTAGNPGICAGLGSVPYSVDILNNQAVWNSLRLGINGSVDLTHTLNFTADLAYTRSNLSAIDYHNLRPDIRGLPEDGTGNGVQLDALLNWQYAPNFQLGVGGRWWHVKTNGFSHFEQSAGTGQAQVVKIQHDSYGVLLQANYQFVDAPLARVKTKEPLSVTVFDWNGFYLGGNIGYGTNAGMVRIYPTQFASLDDLGALNVQDAGFTAGGQLGYNWQIDRSLVGLEGDLAYANISSANAVTALPSDITTSVAKNLKSFGTVRARVGQLASDNMLAYLTAGPAWGRTDLLFTQNPEKTFYGVDLYSSARTTKTKGGWTAGAGVEYAVVPQMTMKAEYLYLHLGTVNANFHDSDAVNLYQVQSKFNTNILRLGVNYKL